MVMGMIKKPNLRDVAEHASVSVGTVSNVLNRPYSVSEQTRARVRTSIDALGFIQDSRKTNKMDASSIVGVILPLSNNAFYEEISQGIEDAVADQGITVLIGYSREDSAVELHLMSRMLEANFGAVIVAPVGRRSDVFTKLKDSRLRVAYFSQTDVSNEQCIVSIDQVRGGYLGLEYLHSLGHKSVLWISGPDHHHQSNERYVGITQAAAQLGVDLSVMQSPSLDFLSGEHIAPEILARGPLPQAIFAGNDSLALGIINYFSKVNVVVPRDVSILGFDNIAYAESALLPLTTVSQTPYQLGHMMGQQMLADLGAPGGHVHQHVIVQPNVVERASTQRRR
jgi:LacI family transcriptional regulator